MACVEAVAGAFFGRAWRSWGWARISRGGFAFARPMRPVRVGWRRLGMRDRFGVAADANF